MELHNLAYSQILSPVKIIFVASEINLLKPTGYVMHQPV